MIVEFIGSTGAGKTTLISEVRQRLAESAEVTTSIGLATGLVGLNGVTNVTVQNLVRELVGFPFFLRSLPRHKTFLRYTLGMIARQENSFFLKLNYLRSLERKIGVEELVRRHNHEGIILVDEGMVLAAYITFVYTDAVYTSEEIAEFARLIPLPDLIVYIRVPVETLVQRTLERPDPPREIRRNPSLTEEYIRRAVDMFEQLVEIEGIKKRVLIVEDSGGGETELESIADHVTKYILNYEPAGKHT